MGERWRVMTDVLNVHLKIYKYKGISVQRCVFSLRSFSHSKFGKLNALLTV